jgi:hypothetical protein
MEEFNEDRARAATIESLRHAGQTLLVNEVMCRDLVITLMGAPDEKWAQWFLDRVQLLLGMVAGRVESGVVLDAAKKPTTTSTEVH